MWCDDVPKKPEKQRKTGISAGNSRFIKFSGQRDLNTRTTRIKSGFFGCCANICANNLYDLLSLSLPFVL